MLTTTSTAAHNAVLTDLLSTGSVVVDGEAVSLRHPEHPDALSHIDVETGELLQQLVRTHKPEHSLEVGLAYGVSTLFICEALAEVSPQATHIVIDPFQNGKWRGIGLQNVRRAGFDGMLDFRERPSELVLPELVANGHTLDFAFIDGLHRFDQVMVEFYYVNRLLRPGGIVAFDDANRRSVKRALRHALTYPCYELASTSAPVAPAQTLPGRVRQRVAQHAAAQRLLRHDVLVRDWDLGLGARCVALRKIDDDNRHTYFDVDF